MTAAGVNASSAYNGSAQRLVNHSSALHLLKWQTASLCGAIGATLNGVAGDLLVNIRL